MGGARSRLRRPVGRRGTALLTFAALDAVWALRLATVRPAQQEFYAWLGPRWPWAILWASVAVVCASRAGRASDRVAFAAAIGIKVLWCSLYLCAWLIAGVHDAWPTAAVWAAFAVIVWLIAGWPEPVEGRGPAWTPPASS